MPEITPGLLYDTLFGSKAAQRGAVIRRKVMDVERAVGRDAFRAELDRRGFSAVENAGQFVIFCNREPIRPFTGAPASQPETKSETARGFWSRVRARTLWRRH